jgi:serine/threonine protein kinase
MTERLRERYEPVAVIGRGGQGEVVRAVDHLHGTTVALKIRRAPAIERDQILREAKTLRALRPHPGVTLVREDFFLDDRYVMVMDWVEGTPLSRVVSEEGAPGLPLEQSIGYLQQVADALDHMHGHDPPIAHGDVKPSNLVRTAHGRVVLVDFGVSGRAGTGTVMTSSDYAAPGLARGEPLSPAVDVYALAATAFALLAGRPFSHGERPTWSGMQPHDARRVEEGLGAGLHPDPLRRPRSAGELVALLRAPAEPPHNLPAPITSFVGRRREIGRARTIVSASTLDDAREQILRGNTVLSGRRSSPFNMLASVALKSFKRLLHPEPE